MKFMVRLSDLTLCLSKRSRLSVNLDLIRGITDPEHPLTLEQLAVVNPHHISVTQGRKPRVLIIFTPTVPHCSMATLIGLCSSRFPSSISLMRCIRIEYSCSHAQKSTRTLQSGYQSQRGQSCFRKRRYVLYWAYALDGVPAYRNDSQPTTQ